MTESGSRRRGAALEHAILDEAWRLLNQLGYSKLTMDDVAQAAKTNKNAIYRRWPQKCYLIQAVIGRQAPLEGEISDQGSLKEDLKALFKILNPIFEIIKPDDLRGVISDMFSYTTYFDLFNFVNQDNDIRKTMEAIITRANQRGEISLSTDTISEKALNLPFLLMINEILLYGRLNEDSSEDIIDHILLPIYEVDK
ncbi:TetR/AcrR family transcriptional regulator [Paenibacillus piscarius]|uniref:TetR/AcrR family transcriptional regulator n=1 Tax=Paenibacillus piscarius TaxID=1089681 RepID=UPI001EE859FC|nr:TetR/AcrR family transcriptional regulator [Paenibacillus piscarius]